MKVTDKKLNQKLTVRFGIDSLTSNKWLIDSKCESNSCKTATKINRFKDLSKGVTLKFPSDGLLSGKLDEVDLDLNGLVINSFQILLIVEANFKLLETNKIDGILGIIKENTSLSEKYEVKSLAERIVAKTEEDNIATPIYFILVLSASYMKFGDLEAKDLILKKKSSDPMYWLNLYEPGKLIMALESVKLVYFDSEGVSYIS